MQTQNTTVIHQSRVVNASPVYYGWVILLAGTIGVILTAPGQTYGVAVFIDYFITDLGISRSLVSSLYTAGTLMAGFTMPFVGRLIDQRGSRQMMALVALALGVACIYIGFVRNAVMLGLGFFALRMLGQGSLSLVSKNAINQWWVRRRGMAMGIAGMGTALLSSGSFPYLINWLISMFGWRQAYMILGLMVWVIILPLALIFVRNRPEVYGLQPDGRSAARKTGKVSTDVPDIPIEENWTRAEALRSSSFWLIAAAMATMSALSTGLTFHIFSIFSDSGLSTAVTAFVFVPMAATAAGVQLVGGFLIDRVPVRLLLATALLLQVIVLVMAPFLGSVWLAYSYGMIAGVRGGLQLIVGNVVWAKYFGRLHLGSITGVVSTLTVGGSALGPMPFGIARDLLGSYTVVLIGFATLPLILAFVTLFFVKPPHRGQLS